MLAPIALALVESAVIAVISGGSWDEHLSPVFTAPPLTILILAVALVLTDGVGEEAGWRGFALPHLLQSMSATTASLLLGLVWAVWHLPLLWTEGSALDDAQIWVLFARLPATAVVYTWLFLRTGGSALSAVVFHAMLNLVGNPVTFGGGSLIPVAVSLCLHWAAALAIILAWRRSRHDLTSRRPSPPGSPPPTAELR